MRKASFHSRSFVCLNSKYHADKKCDTGRKSESSISSENYPLEFFNRIHFSFNWSNDEMFESMSSADCGLTRIETDPLLLMLQRLEAASKITTSDCDEALDFDYSLPTPIY